LNKIITAYLGATLLALLLVGAACGAVPLPAPTALPADAAGPVLAPVHDAPTGGPTATPAPPLPRDCGAPPTESKSSVTVTVDANLHATLAVEGPDDLRSCVRVGLDCNEPGIKDLEPVHLGKKRVAGFAVLEPTFDVGDLATRAAAPGAPGSISSRFIQSLLRPGAELACKMGVGGALQQVKINVPALKNRVFSTEDRVIAPDYEWTGLDTLYGPGLRQLLGGNPTGCTYLADGVTEPKAGSASNCTLVPYSPLGALAGVHYRMQITGSPTTGAVKLAFPGGGKPAITFAISTCTFSPTGSPETEQLVPGANPQTLELTGSLPECESRLVSHRGFVPVSLVNGSTTISGVAAARVQPVIIDLTSVPATLPEGVGTWEVHDAGGALIGRVSIPTTKPISVDPILQVAYRDQELAAASGKSAAKTAVVDPYWVRGDADEPSLPQDKVYLPGDGREANVTNTAIVTVPAGLVPTSPSAKLIEAASDEDEKRRSAPSPTTAWLVPASAGTADPILIGADLIGGDGPLAGKRVIRDLRRLTFRMRNATTGGVALTVELWNIDSRSTFKYPVLRVTLSLADQARKESVPLPIADLLRVVCKGDHWNDMAASGELIAISEGALPSGECWVHPDYSVLYDHFHLDHAYLLGIYGPQTLSVVVSRNGTTAPAKQTLALALDPRALQKYEDSGCQQRRAAEPKKTLLCQQEKGLVDPFTLQGPTGDGGGPSDPYQVNIDVAVRDHNDEVTYRQGADSTLGAGDVPVQPHLRFSAMLRSRGTFGVPAAVRAFATIPIDVFGIRFGASARDLKSSSSPTQFEVLGPRVGLLVGLEPWDYKHSRNLWAVLGPRFVTGLYVFQFTQPNVSVSWVTGAQLTLPIFEQAKTAQLDSSVGFGLYYEVDLRDEAFSRASQHFLFTTSLNLLNLFGTR
jgi:hypothetical protein